MRVCVEQSLSLLIWDPETDLQMEKLKEFVIQNEFEELEKEREKKRLIYGSQAAGRLPQPEKLLERTCGH